MDEPALSPSPLSDLPVELIRLIFLTAARTSRRSALALVLVSRQVKHWVTPVLYSIVTLTTHRRFDTFCFQLARINNKTVRAACVDRVKALHMPVDHPLSNSILSRCTKLEHLAIKASHLTGPGGDRTCSAIPARPNRLVLFGFPTVAHPLFANVTHLSIYSVPIELPLQPGMFPSLTHLMAIHVLDNTPSQVFLRNVRKTAGRIPFDSASAADKYHDGVERFRAPLKLMVLNISIAPARPDHDRVMEIWKYEDILASEGILMRPSERLTLDEWMEEVSYGSYSTGKPGGIDRWERAERALLERQRELGLECSVVTSMDVDSSPPTRCEPLTLTLPPLTLPPLSPVPIPIPLSPSEVDMELEADATPSLPIIDLARIEDNPLPFISREVDLDRSVSIGPSGSSRPRHQKRTYGPSSGSVSFISP